jgi:hypothetical protein
MNGWSAQEIDIFAPVVSPRQAGLTLVANDSRFYSDAISYLEMRDGRVSGENDASGFVAEYVVAFHDHGTDTALVPEVNV